MVNVNRRQWIHGLAAAVGASSLTSGSEAAPAHLTPSEDLFLGLDPGAALDQCTLVAVHPVTLGAIPLVLSDAQGARFQVDLVARDRLPGAPHAVADTEHYSLFLANVGHGRTATLEAHGLAVMALAAALREREPHALRPALLTLRARVEAFPTGAFYVLERA